MAIVFYKNILKTKQTDKKQYKFNLFQDGIVDKDDSICDSGSAKICYNFNFDSGALSSSYGFTELASPTTNTDTESETQVSIRGSEIKSIWKLKWYDFNTDSNNYYLFYYNNEGYVCYDNLYGVRLATYVVPNTFTTVPYAAYYRTGQQDTLLLSGDGDDLVIITGSGVQRNEDAPKIVSCCSHYGRLFAITSSERGTLVYSDNTDILTFTDELCQNLDFSDERGDLNKIISFNDYLYIFRDYGITEVSIYGLDQEFAVSHLYFSNSYIYPNTIAVCGDEIIFLDSSGLKVFNGSSVKKLDCPLCDKIKLFRQQYAYAEYFDGKYFLACKLDFQDGNVIGCENYADGYLNNTLLIYDIAKETCEVVRGVDIKMLLTLPSPYKTKLVACFNNEFKGKIGQLTIDGKIFGNNLEKCWQSAFTDLGESGTLKKIKSFIVKSENPCSIKIESDLCTKTFDIGGKETSEMIYANVTGHEFRVSIFCTLQPSISNLVLNVEAPK